MAIINLKFRNTNFNLDVDNVDRASKLAERFTERVDAFANQNNATDLKMAFVAGLIVEDELENLQIELLKKQVSKTSDAAVGVLTDTINQVSSYIEQLADRVEGR